MKISTFTLVISAIFTVSFPGLHADEVKPLDLSKMQLGPQAQLVSEDGQHLIRIKSTPGNKPKDILFFELNEPKITQNAFALTGDIRYENVAGRSYLETWNHFISNQNSKSEPVKFFTRGLNHTGPMAVLSANSDWREFQLPFFINPKGQALQGPNKITFNLHLEGRGVVEIRNVKLVDGLENISLPKPLPKPMEVLYIIMMYTLGPVLLITLLVILRRKKRTADELRRIRAADIQGPQQK